MATSAVPCFRLCCRVAAAGCCCCWLLLVVAGAAAGAAGAAGAAAAAAAAAAVSELQLEKPRVRHYGCHHFCFFIVLFGLTHTTLCYTALHYATVCSPSFGLTVVWLFFRLGLSRLIDLVTTQG